MDRLLDLHSILVIGLLVALGLFIFQNHDQDLSTGIFNLLENGLLMCLTYYFSVGANNNGKKNNDKNSD